MKLSIIIVSWNVCREVLDCLASIANHPPSGPYEVILVDNAGADDTVPQVRKRFPEVTVIENKRNMGFAAANNVGIRQAQGEYLLFLNPDTQVLDGSLDQLITFIQAHPEVGLCGPQILNPDMSIQRSARRFPSVAGMFYRFTFFKYLGIFRGSARRWKMDDFDHRTQKQVDQLMGAALLVSADFIRVLNGFDERFFMYYEEVDLCFRIRQKARSVVFFPDSTIIHLGGRSAEKVPAKVKSMKLCSLLLFMKKHHAAVKARLLLVLFKLCVLMRELIDMIKFLIMCLLSLLRPEKMKKNYSGLKSCFLFIIKYYIRFLLT